MSTFDEVSKSVDATLRRWIDERHRLTGAPREILCIDAGKALVMLGCSFIGIAIGIADPDAGLQPGRDCLAKFQEMADATDD